MNGITAELVVFDLHGNIMRRIGERMEVHHEGMTAAANYLTRRGIITEKFRNILQRLDHTYHVIRHINYASCMRDLYELDAFLDQHDNPKGKADDHQPPREHGHDEGWELCQDPTTGARWWSNATRAFWFYELINTESTTFC